MATELKKILLRRDTQANLDSSDTVGQGEPVYATDTEYIGVGTGTDITYFVKESELDIEVQARESADTELQGNIDDEATTRESEDIRVLQESKTYTDGKVAQIIGDEVGEAFDTLSEIEEAVTTNTSDIELKLNKVTSEELTFSGTDKVHIKEGSIPILSTFNYGDNGTVTTIGGNTFVGRAGNATMGSTAIDSGEASSNTAVGAAALESNTRGFGNTANGYLTLHNNTTGYNNTANGKWALLYNTTGSSNTANGYQALAANQTGDYNTATGVNALRSNTQGHRNTANGEDSLSYSETGNYNTANGYRALRHNKTGSNGVAIGYQSQQYANDTTTAWTNYNTSLGYEALRGSDTPSDNTGNYNTSIGYQTLFSNTDGSGNTANGYQALNSNTGGNWNTANGQQALFNNTSGYRNTANGYYALYSNTISYSNTANGYRALFSNTEGNANTANGYQSLDGNTTGYNNTANGAYAGSFIADGSTGNTTGSNSTFIGSFTKANADGETNQTVIGFNATGLGSNTVVLGNDAIVTTALKGNVGIGTTSPSAKLDVVGDIAVSGTVDGVDIAATIADLIARVTALENA